eukprot:scaffold442_cov397-Prasinococcus_capsulatus_cf.AAC.31
MLLSVTPPPQRIGSRWLSDASTRRLEQGHLQSSANVRSFAPALPLEHSSPCGALHARFGRSPPAPERGGRDRHWGRHLTKTAARCLDHCSSHQLGVDVDAPTFVGVQPRHVPSFTVPLGHQ